MKWLKKINPSQLTLLWPAIFPLPQPVCIKEVKPCNKNMKLLIQSNCNEPKNRFKGALRGLIQSYNPRKSSSLKNAKVQGKYIDVLVGFAFLRFIYALSWQPGPQLHPAPCVRISPYWPHLPKEEPSSGVPTIPYSSTPGLRAPLHPGVLARSGSHCGAKWGCKLLLRTGEGDQSWKSPALALAP